MIIHSTMILFTDGDSSLMVGHLILSERLSGMHPCARFKAMVAGKFMAVKKASREICGRSRGRSGGITNIAGIRLISFMNYCFVFF